ncbi:hypothetical protein SAMN04487954_101407 [Billgrantia gudaonensis]|uniref:Uncharacterized protein n=1 Tax=Billgrantia gudaonensis TaxID=376427 RepID=A0A1G8NR37_9GAMM|nr:hypothetical protein SAMN04487954_101407 [Halomonas gudaonensis]
MSIRANSGGSLDRYGVVVMIVHEAREGCYVLLDWWTGENMLQHHVYFSRDPNDPEFSDVTQTGIVACVWELKVLSFEREAWIDCVLAREEPSWMDTAVVTFPKMCNSAPITRRCR